MDNTYINCFNNLISKLLTLNNSVYDKYISNKVYDTLFDKSNTNKQLFYDFFSNIQDDNKDEIIKNILSIIINKTDIVLKSTNKENVAKISNYIDKCENKDILIKIIDYIQYNKQDNIPDELLNNLKLLNRFDIIAVKSICLNCMKYSISSIKHNLNSIISNKNNFLIDPSSYKNNIVELLNFYIPIYGELYYIPCNGIFDIKDDYKIFFIFDLARTDLNRSNDINELKFNIIPLTFFCYLLTYEYIISAALGFFNKDDEQFKSTIKLILTGGSLDEHTIRYIFDCYKKFSPLSSLEDKIESIKEIKNDDNYIYQTIATYDIGRYKIKQKKKRAFGL